MGGAFLGGQIVKMIEVTSSATGEATRYICGDGTVWRPTPLLFQWPSTGARRGVRLDDQIYPKD